MTTSPPQLDLDEMMGRLRAGTEPGGPEAVDARPPGSFGKQVAVDCAQAPSPCSARELMALPETEFVRACYLSFLGREASPREISRQRDRLLAWKASRLRIVRELCASEEGRAHQSRVEGLWKVLAWDRLYWSPPAKAWRALGHAIGFVRRLRERLEKAEQTGARTASVLARLERELAADRHSAMNQNRHMQERMSAIRQLTEDVRTALVRRAEAIERAHAGSTSQLERETAELKVKLVDHWRAIIDQKLHIESMLAAAPAEPPREGTIANPAPGGELHFLDALYLSFEDRYRGSRADVKERQRVYLPYVFDCVSNLGGSVLDIGCGRGEWLELLRESGHAAQGFDLNRIAIEECRARDLAVHLGDGIAALRNMAESSISVITAFHVIEHLSFESLVSLLDHGLRVLRPGGILVLETPNPANLLVAAERFYLDPTHRNPLPSGLVSYLVESRGFERAEVLPLHPVERPAAGNHEEPLLAMLQEKFYGAQDYGVIACKAG